MITIYDLIESAEAYALEAKLNPTEASLWRSIERKYSKVFNTPLHQVKDLDPIYVLNALYENELESLIVSDDEQFDEILEILYRLQDPDYDANREKEEEEYNKQAVIEEEERLAKIAAKKKAKKPVPAKPVIDPLKGGVNLGYLANNPENES